MSKMSDLDISVGELCSAASALHTIADSLQTVADSIAGNTPQEDSGPQLDNPPQKHTVPEITLEQVRAILAEKSGDGKRQEVKTLLTKYDAGKLSGVKPEDYAALMEEALKL